MVTEQKIDAPQQKILLVDDRAENLFAMEIALRSLEADIVKSQSGREALSMLLVHDFDVVLMDVQMPEMDGIETATLIKGNTKTSHLPIIFVTAIDKEQGHIFKGYETGAAVDYLFKPVDPDILRAKVKVFLRLGRQKKELAMMNDCLEKAYELLSQKNKRLAELSETAHHFVDHVSHEFRTPLTVIREYATIIRDGLAGPGDRPTAGIPGYCH